MNLIFSADENWGIGRDGQLLFRTKGDMAFFRKTTTGKVVVMGRKTLESLPGGRPLPGRENVVLTRDAGFKVEGAAVCNSLESLFAHLEGRQSDEVFVIGGAEIYRLLMPYCAKAYVTRWDAETEADSFVPDFDHSDGWRLEEQSPPQTEDGITCRSCLYLQDSPLPPKKS